MVRRLTLLLVVLCLLVGLPGVIRGEVQEKLKAFAICERIKTQGICEEYNLNALSLPDKQLVTKYCLSGRRCPAEKRVGRCLGFKGPDGIAFDKHYYSGTAKGYDWKPSCIEVTCKNVGGKYEDG